MASVQRYVDEVLALPAVAGLQPGAGSITVRSRRSATAAHYEGAAGAGVIAVADRLSADWALRELVIFFGHFTAVYAHSSQ